MRLRNDLIIDYISLILAFLLAMVTRYGENFGFVFFSYHHHIYLLLLAIGLVLITVIQICRSKGENSRLTAASTEGQAVSAAANPGSSSFVHQLVCVLENNLVLLLCAVVLMFLSQTGDIISRRVVVYIFIYNVLIETVARTAVLRISRHKAASTFRNNTDSPINPVTNRQQGVMIDDHVVRLLAEDELPAWTAKVSPSELRHVFAVGSKGIPASYGGFESFMDNLTRQKQDSKLLYHVARLSQDTIRFEYNNAVCFDMDVPDIGSAKAVYYDCAALSRCIRYCEEHAEIKRPVFFIMACRIGPFIGHYVKKIHQMGGTVLVNPDGHEWKRAKWNYWIRRYWKYSERLMVKHADLLVCDSRNIEKYIHEEYQEFHPKTTYIAYGSDIAPSTLSDQDPEFQNWLQFNNVTPGGYYLIVGRFVPENNFETMLREFMRSHTKRSLVIITTSNDAFMQKLDAELHFSTDIRIKFVGTVYNDQLLKKIRENAYAYLHGHEVGGTNPSLLEALSSTKINLLLDVGFNREVAEDAALYWTKEQGSLSSLIDQADQLTDEQIEQLGQKAVQRIREGYSWEYIVGRYEETFLYANN